MIGKLKELRKGSDIAIIVIGTVINEALKAADDLKYQNKNISVYSVYTLKPLDKQEILNIAKKHKYILTIEEHQIVGGLGSTISEIIAESGIAIKVIRLGLHDEFTSIVGNQEYLRKVYNMDTESIKKRIVDLK